jgi:hypothetical protein
MLGEMRVFCRGFRACCRVSLVKIRSTATAWLCSGWNVGVTARTKPGGPPFKPTFPLVWAAHDSRAPSPVASEKSSAVSGSAWTGALDCFVGNCATPGYGSGFTCNGEVFE